MCVISIILSTIIFNLKELILPSGVAFVIRKRKVGEEKEERIRKDEKEMHRKNVMQSALSTILILITHSTTITC